MAETYPPNRRRFKRIPFEHPVCVIADDGRHECDLLDVSFRGALLAPADGWVPAVNDRVSVHLPLTEGEELRIAMDGTVVRSGEHDFAVRCDEMDLESTTLLRRLVEVNLGDPALLERELSAFIDAA